MRAKFVIPVVLFLLLTGLFIFGLQNDPKEIPSVLIGKPAPQVNLPDLYSQNRLDINKAMLGTPWILNVWASWCLACKDEHPLLVEVQQQYPDIRIIGLNYKDDRADALAWLEIFKDPYTHIVQDIDARVGINFGVYGVPETFVISAQGKIVYKHIGPITQDDIQQHILPLVQAQ